MAMKLSSGMCYEKVKHSKGTDWVWIWIKWEADNWPEIRIIRG